MSNTSVRVIDTPPFAITAGSLTPVNIFNFSIPESTYFLTVLVDPAMTQGVFVFEPTQTVVSPSGLYIPPGQSMQLGPFTEANCPIFGGLETGTIYISILPVFSER